jgi:hypothetical protein
VRRTFVTGPDEAEGSHWLRALSRHQDLGYDEASRTPEPEPDPSAKPAGAPQGARDLGLVQPSGDSWLRAIAEAARTGILPEERQWRRASVMAKSPRPQPPSSLTTAQGRPVIAAAASARTSASTGTFGPGRLSVAVIRSEATVEGGAHEEGQDLHRANGRRRVVISRWLR